MWEIFGTLSLWLGAVVGTKSVQRTVSVQDVANCHELSVVSQVLRSVWG